MRGVGRKLFKSKIAHNAASLYLVQACRKLIPLFTLPYLARVLGPSGWGDVAFTQSMGEFIAIFIEFGFLLSATRDLAQNRSSKDASGRIAVGTFGAQAVLATVGVVIALAVSTQVPLLSSHPKLLCAGIIYGVAQGMSPLWLFQGLERMALAASLEVSSKIAALGAILLFVHSPSDEWKVLAFQSLAPVVTMLVGFWMAHRLLTLYLPGLDMVWRALRTGWPMFLLRSGAATYSTANVLILALFAPASIVGYYASAEKLAKAMTGLLMPIRDAFYPRLSQLAAHSNDGESASNQDKRSYRGWLWTDSINRRLCRGPCHRTDRFRKHIRTRRRTRADSSVASLHYFSFGCNRLSVLAACRQRSNRNQGPSRRRPGQSCICVRVGATISGQGDGCLGGACGSSSLRNPGMHCSENYEALP